MSSDKSSSRDNKSASSSDGFFAVDPAPPPSSSGDGVARALAQLKPGASPSVAQLDKLQLTEPRSTTGESVLYRKGVVNDKFATVGDRVMFDQKDVKPDVAPATSTRTPSSSGLRDTDFPLSFPLRHEKNAFMSPMSGSVKTSRSVRSNTSFKSSGSLKDTAMTSLFYSGLDPKNDYCCGIIGKNGLSFCTKRKHTCQVYARRGSHFTDRADVKPDLVYIQKSVNTAWEAQCVEEEFLEQFIASKGSLPNEARMDQWKAIFSAARKCDSEDLDTEEVDRIFKFHNSPVKREDLKTPGKVAPATFESIFEKQVDTDEAFNAKVGIYLSEAAIEDWTKANIPSTLIDQVKSFSSYLRDLGAQLDDVQVSSDLFAEAKDVSADLLNITASIQGIKESIGDIATLSHPDFCSSLSDLNDQMEKLVAKVNSSPVDVHFVQKVDFLSHEWENFKQSWLPALAEHEVLLSDIDDRIVKLETEKPIQSISSLSPKFFADINKKERAAQARLDALEAAAGNVDIQGLLDTVQSLTLKVTDLQEQINQSTTTSADTVTNRIPDPFHWIEHEGLSSDSVSFGTFHFEKGEVSILAFIKKFMTRPRPGLFNDLNTLFEFMPGEIYVEKGTTLGNLNHGNKIGFTNAADATVATSFDNILPGLFARIRATQSGIIASGASEFAMSSHPELPGLPNYKDWDAGDTNTGRKFFILRNLKSTKTLIDGWIRSDLRGDAQILAFELLAASVYMAQELVQFISGVYHDLCTSGRFDDTQAWGLACKFVKRIFSEIGDERVVARDNIHCDDLWASTAKIIFGILKAHKVMKEFMHLNLRDHPSISSEMVKFVCYSQPASDTSRVLEQLEEMSSLTKKTSANVSKHESRIKKIENWKDEATKTLKKVN